MMTAARCPSCGQQAPAGSSFCAYCGSRIGSQTEGSTPVTSVSRFQGGVFGETNYIIDQKLLSFRDTFGIKDESGNLLACVKRELLGFGPKFWFEAPQGQSSAKSRARFSP